VVLKSNERDRETRVVAEPELERNVQGGLRKRVADLALLRRHSAGRARGVRGVLPAAIRQEGELGGLTHHLVVATALGVRERQLVPDVHRVTILAINALATDLDLDLRDELLTRIVEPAGRRKIVRVSAVGTARERARDGAVNHRERHLEVRPVREITVARDDALNPATEVGLAVERLLDRLHSEVRVAPVRDLPESDLGVTREVDVLRAVGHELHQSSSHRLILAQKIFRAKSSKTNLRQLHRPPLCGGNDPLAPFHSLDQAAERSIENTKRGSL